MRMTGCRNVAESGEYWRDLRLDLLWCYEGRPLARKAHTHGTSLTAWLLLEGRATVKSGGLTVKASRGQWLVCHRPDRWQDFSDSARIVSIHLAFSCPSLAAEWSGPNALRFPHGAELEAAMRKLRATTALTPLPPENRRLLWDMKLPLIPALELREATFGFAHVLLAALEKRGMRFGPVEIRDDRVRASRLDLSGRDLRTPFSRRTLAKAHGVSASQLGRLWRGETGETPRHYWDRRRLAAACEALLDGRQAIKTIAYDLGFQHLSRFSIWFRDKTGLTPSDYRNRPMHD